MSKLDAKMFSSITPFAKQWILGDELMYEFLNEYQDFLNEGYGIVDLGALTWSMPSAGLFFSTDLANIIKKPADNTATNMIKDLFISTGNYIITYLNNLPQASGYYAGIASSGRLYIQNLDYSTAAAFKAAMSGVYVIFPFTDNIGRVEMGHLSWQRNAANPGGFSVPGTVMQPLGIKQGLCTLYCSKLNFYSGVFSWDSFSNIPDNIIAKNDSNYALYAKDTDYSAVADFKESLTNIWLYYEKAV